MNNGSDSVVMCLIPCNNPYVLPQKDIRLSLGDDNEEHCGFPFGLLSELLLS